MAKATQPSFLAIDPGGSAGIAFLSNTGRLTAVQGFDAARPLLEAAANCLTVIGIEDVHAVRQAGKQGTFNFGRTLGLWEGVLRWLGLSWVKIPVSSWQEICLSKPQRPSIAGLRRSAANAVIAAHRAAIKAESMRAAQKAFPKAVIPCHDVADAINMARYLQWKHRTQKR